MIETALEISPDFAAHIGPAFAEGEVLAEISPGCVVDHAIEQCKPVGASGERIDGMFAKKLQRRVSGMLTHFFQDVTPDHQETGAGVTHPRESVDRNYMIRIFDFQHVIERGRRCGWSVGIQHPSRLVPVDPLDGIDPGHHVRARFDQPVNLVRREADIRVHEQKMRCTRIVEKLRHQIGSRPGNQRVALAHQNRQVDVGP